MLALGITAASAAACGGGGGATSTSLKTTLSGGGKEGEEITVAEGSGIKDTATLSGENASKATGTVKYALYKDKACKELFANAGEVTVKEGKVPASEEKKPEGGAVYYWQAVYSGDTNNLASTSTCGKEVLTVKATTSLSTTLSGGGKEGEEITVAEGSGIKDTATLSGTKSSTATGTVKYALYKDKACKELASSAGEATVKEGKAVSEEKKPEAGAIYYWRAEYSGDSLHEASTSTCGKEVLTVKAALSLSTSLVGQENELEEIEEGKEITVTGGTVVADSALLSGTASSTATGPISYSVYADSKCSELVAEAGKGTVEAGKVPSSEIEELELGTYYWQVQYSGDSLHQSSTSPCTEIVHVVAATSLTTELSAKTGESLGEGNVIVGAGMPVSDSAGLGGANAAEATGTVKYSVYADEECKELITGAGEATVKGESIPPSEEVLLEEGTYYWQAAYSGDTANHKSVSGCGSEIEIVAPPVTTELSGGGKSGTDIEALEGTPVQDTAKLWSTHASKATGTVKYAVYADDTCEELVASAGEVTVKGEKVPPSEEVSLEEGTYFWLAEYSGDTENPKATSACGIEVLTVVTPTELGMTLVGGEEKGEKVEIEEGAGVKAEATLSGANAGVAYGAISYAIYSDSECTEPVDLGGDFDVSKGSVPASDEVILPYGTYYWQAEYFGDGVNDGSVSSCGSNTVVVTAPITSKLSGGEESGDEIEVPEKTPVSDKATLHGKYASEATGTFTYAVYADEECTELITKAGEVTVKGAEVPPSEEVTLGEEGTYFWQVEYSGDEKNPAATSPCGDEEQLIVNPAQEKYAALGDSYSSGEGIRFPAVPPGGRARGTYYASTNVGAVVGGPAADQHTANRCHRSRQAWPALIANAVWAGSGAENEVMKKQPPHFIFRACSGARTFNLWRNGVAEAVAAEGGQYDELLTPPHEWRSTPTPAQDLWLGLPGGKFPFTGNNNAIRAVTLTIGGNDAGFAAIARACWQVTNRWLAGPYDPRPCWNRIATEETAGFPAILARLPVVLRHIRQVAPQARIRIPLYPRVLNLGGAVVDLGGGLSFDNTVHDNPPVGPPRPTVAQSLEIYIAGLNRTIEEAVQMVDPRGQRIQVVPGTVDAFNNAVDGRHRLGDPAPWMNGIHINAEDESLHPTLCGQLAIARIVLPLIRRGVAAPARC